MSNHQIADETDGMANISGCFFTSNRSNSHDSRFGFGFGLLKVNFRSKDTQLTPPGLGFECQKCDVTIFFVERATIRLHSPSPFTSSFSSSSSEMMCHPRSRNQHSSRMCLFGSRGTHTDGIHEQTCCALTSTPIGPETSNLHELRG
jgi:hypothetical protein